MASADASHNNKMDLDGASERTLTPDPITSPLAYLTNESQQLIRLNDKLSALGIDNKDSSIQLSRIALIGDQSNGKSCLTFMLTGINMPRDSGTCTRVPFHINTSKSKGPWKCNIYLDKAWSFHTVAANRDPWEQTEATSSHFAECHDAKELENLLRRAQAALLHPTDDPARFLHCSISELNDQRSVGFSRNVVRLQVESQDVSNISVFDLPGIYSQDPNPNQQHLPKFVHKLVSEYAKAPNNIILLVMALTSDPENSMAAKLVRDLKATDRALGVLTKPDRLESHASYNALTAMLDGEAFPLGYGYCVTRLPTQKELVARVTREQAIDNEHDFFSNSPWFDDLARYSTRFGTVNVQDRVSELLVKRIKLYLPELQAKIQLQLDGVSSRVHALPKPVNDAAAVVTVCERLSRIQTDLQLLLAGDYPHTQLVNKCKQLLGQMAIDLTATKPTLQQKSRTISSQSTEAIDLCDDDDDDSMFLPNTPSSRKRGSASLTKSTPSPKKQKVAIPSRIKRETSSTTRNEHSVPDLTNKSPSTALQSTQYTLDQLRQLAIKVDVSGVAGDADSRAIGEIVQPVLNTWNAPVARFLATSFDSAQHHIDQLFQVHLEKVSGTPLRSELPPEARALLFQMWQDVKKSITEIVHDYQRTRTIVTNQRNFQRLRKEELNALLGNTADNHEDTESKDDLSGTPLELLARANACIEQSIDHLVEYCGKRVQGALARAADSETGLIATIQNKWVTEGGTMKCQALLELNPRQAQERVSLEKRKANLEKALGLVQEFLDG